VERATWQPLLQAFPTPRLLGRGHCFCLLQLACLFTVRMRECPSPSPEVRAPRPLCYMSFFFCFSAANLYFSLFFFFFPPWAGVSLSRGLC
jgi:hypothetical protein